MNKYEFRNTLSKQMQRAFDKALDEALLPCRKVNNELWTKHEELHREWDEAHRADWEKRQADFDKADEEIRALQDKINELSRAKYDAYDNARKELFARYWEDTKEIREQDEPIREENSRKWKLTEQIVIEQFQRKLAKKAEKENN